MRFMLVLLMMVGASGLMALEVQLTTETKPMRVEPIGFDEGQFTFEYKNKQQTRDVDDFTPASAFEIAKHYSAQTAKGQLDLARFGVRRGVFDPARKTMERVLRLDRTFADRVDALAKLTDTLEADALIRTAQKHLRESKLEEAESALEDLLERFPKSQFATKATILLETLKRSELLQEARTLANEARKAQAEVDQAEEKARGPVDRWLDKQDDLIRSLSQAIDDGNTQCVANQVTDGLSTIASAVTDLIAIRKNLAQNTDWYKHRGQSERSERLQKKAKDALLRGYERWTHWLVSIRRWQKASTVCNLGLALEPANRKLLLHRVDIDEQWDATDGG